MYAGLDEAESAFAAECRAYAAADPAGSPQAALADSGAVLADLARHVTGLAEAARVDGTFALTLLGNLAVRAVTSALPAGPVGLLLPGDDEPFLAAAGLRAERTAAGWSLRGEAVRLGAGTPAAVLAADGDGALLFTLSPDAPDWRVTLDGLPRAEGDLLATLDPAAMTRVRDLLRTGAAGILVGLADARLPYLAGTLSRLAGGRGDRWVGQAAKHRLADVAATRDVAWLEAARAIESSTGAGRGLHSAVAAHEGLVAVDLLLEEIGRVAGSQADRAELAAAAATRSTTEVLEALLGGRSRLRDQVTGFLLDAR
ncbi:MAG TPA: hypothetical protein VGP36_18560 [Mycobacteriales bacterium]|nr:hypothetical protein [Mycobacteriales bacterium]